jgi:ABC-2 type transport system permease protein
MTSLLGFVRKEVYHILRDTRTLLVLILLPVVAVLLFGFAIRTDVKEIRIAIVDPAPDHASLALRARFESTALFRTRALLPDVTALDALFRRGVVQQALIFEPDFGERLGRGEGARVLVVTDATDPNTGSILQSHALSTIRRHERELAGRGSAAVTIMPELRMRFNPTMESVNLFVPGLIAYVLTIICVLMTAISLTREKETGTMEVLLVSPLRPGRIIVGKVLPYLLLGFFNAVTVLALAAFIFHVPISGSLPLLLAYCLLYVLTALALGVLISTRTDSQRVATMAALAGMLLPTLMLSGFIFPIESMPRLLQWVSNVVPAKWFLIIVRGIMLKGVGIEHLWKETLILLGMTAFFLTAGVRNFRIRIA